MARNEGWNIRMVKIYEVKISFKESENEKESWLQIVAVDKAVKIIEDDSNLGLAIFLNNKFLMNLLVRKCFYDVIIDENSFVFIHYINSRIYANDKVMELYKVTQRMENKSFLSFDEEFDEHIETDSVEKMRIYNKSSIDFSQIIKLALLNPYVSQDDNLMLYELPQIQTESIY